MLKHDFEFLVPVFLRISDACFPVRTGHATPPALIGSERFRVRLPSPLSREYQLPVVPADEVITVPDVPHVLASAAILLVLSGLADLPVLGFDVGLDAAFLQLMMGTQAVVAAVGAIDPLRPGEPVQFAQNVGGCPGVIPVT